MRITIHKVEERPARRAVPEGRIATTFGHYKDDGWIDALFTYWVDPAHKPLLEARREPKGKRWRILADKAQEIGWDWFRWEEELWSACQGDADTFAELSARLERLAMKGWLKAEIAYTQEPPPDHFVRVQFEEPPRAGIYFIRLAGSP